ncbi:MAG: glutaredoxin family protein [Anaerolineae bacterium]
MTKRVVMYSRERSCADVDVARRVLSILRVPYQEINIEEDESARERVMAWTGRATVPTIVIAEGSGVEPLEPVGTVTPGSSPRGVDRGALISEPSADELRAFLEKHDLVPVAREQAPDA